MITEIYFCTLDAENANAGTYMLLHIISEERRQRIERLHFESDKQLSLLSELLVRYCAAKKLGIKNKEIAFGRDSYGKPYLHGFPSLRFSLSHTHSAVVVALSGSEIGVDIEKIKPVDLDIAQRFFSMRERGYVAASLDPHKAFFEIWTKKEAYIKHQGKGVSIPFISFDVFDERINQNMVTVRQEEYIISSYGHDITPAVAFMAISECELIGFFDHMK